MQKYTLNYYNIDELELSAGGLNEETARKHIYQVLQALQFIHQNNVSYFNLKENRVPTKEILY